jgi:hypothetical protein
MRLDYRLCAVLMVAVSFAGSWAAHALSLWAVPDPASGFHEYYLRGLAQPIPVVQFGKDWSVPIAVWTMFAAIAWLGTLLVRDATARSKRPVLVVMVSFAIVGLALTTFSIIQAYDIYYYTAYGRLYGLYRANPYSYGAPYSMPDASLSQNFIMIHNPPFPSPYGPGFTLFSGLVGRFEAAASLQVQLWSWRAIAVFAVLLTAAALLRQFRGHGPAAAARRIGTFAFHPVILYEAAIGGHNDFLMLAPAVWAWALFDEMPLIAALLLGASISVKYVALVLLPFFAIRAAAQSKLLPVFVVLIALGIPWLAYQPFVARPTAAAGVLESVGSGLLMSLTWLLTLPWLHGTLDQTPLFQGLGPLPLIGELTGPRAVQLAIVAAALCVIAWSIWRFVRERIASHVYRAVTSLIWALPALHPWYVAWLGPALGGDGAWARYAWWFGALSLLTYAEQGVVPTAINQAIFVAIVVAVLAVPIIVARLAPGQPRARARAVRP